MNNYEKRDRYAHLMKKLKIATDNEYYYEAIFIEYAILEDRTKSLLKHAGIDSFFINNKGKKEEFTLKRKLDVLKFNKKFQEPQVKKHLTNELIEEISKWKNVRNMFIHDLVNAEYDNKDVKRIAINGEALIKRLNSKSTSVNDYFDKNNESGSIIKKVAVKV